MRGASAWTPEQTPLSPSFTGSFRPQQVHIKAIAKAGQRKARAPGDPAQAPADGAGGDEHTEAAAPDAADAPDADGPSAH